MSELKLNTPLTAQEVDFRIQSINKGGYATILVYKDARVDMKRLNDVYGIGFWQRKHELINGKEFCSVGIWNKDIGQWCWVQDCGTKSNTEAEKAKHQTHLSAPALIWALAWSFMITRRSA